MTRDELLAVLRLRADRAQADARAARDSGEHMRAVRYIAEARALIDCYRLIESAEAVTR